MQWCNIWHELCHTSAYPFEFDYISQGSCHSFLRARTCHSIRCRAGGFYNSVRMHFYGFFSLQLMLSMRWDFESFYVKWKLTGATFVCDTVNSRHNSLECTNLCSSTFYYCRERRNLMRRDIKFAENWNLAIKLIVYIVRGFIGWIQAIESSEKN